MWLNRAHRGARVVAAIALLLVAFTGAALTWRYRPDAGGAEHLLPPSPRWSRRLVRWHEVSMLVAAPALIAVGGLTAADRTAWSRRKWVRVSSSITAAGLIVLTARSWQQVRWEQLGLWAVTVGDDIQGLWYPAFSDEVRFAIVNGAEVPPSTLAPWVVLHLLAPVLSLAFVAVGWMVLEPPRTPRRSIVAAAPGDSGSASG